MRVITSQYAPSKNGCGGTLTNPTCTHKQTHTSADT